MICLISHLLIILLFYTLHGTKYANKYDPMKKFYPILFLGAVALVYLSQKNLETSPDTNVLGVTSKDSTTLSFSTDEKVAIIQVVPEWVPSESTLTEREILIEKLQIRKNQRRKLMREDPQEFLRTAVSIHTYAGLPQELKPLVEKPFSAVGSMDVQWETSITPEKKFVCTHQNIFSSGKETFDVIHSAGKEYLPSTQEIVNGYTLGDQLLVTEETVRILPPEDVEGALTLFEKGNPNGLDPITGQPATQVNALLAGKVVAFSNPDIPKNLETQLASNDQAVRQWVAGNIGGSQGPADVAATPYQENQIDVLFIRVDFSDIQGEPISKEDLETTLNSVDDHIDDFSYGQAGITNTVSTNFYRMPRTGASYAVNGDNDDIQTDARALASADYTLSNYDVIAVYFPSLSNVTNSQITYGGLASIGIGNGIPSHWINGSNNIGVILHEFGHNFGLYHANYDHPEMQLGGSYEVPGSLEYGDIFDVMGNGNEPEAHFNPLALNYLKWMPDSKVAEASADGTWRIYRFDTYNALSSSTLALKVPMAGGTNFWVGFRQLFTTSTYNLENAAYVVGENMANQRETSLIDMTPESEASETLDRFDAGLPVGGSYYNSDAGVTFETLAIGGTEPNQWIDVRITFDPRIRLKDSLIEVDEQTGNARVVVQRSFSSLGSVSIGYSTSNGTATAGSDYYSSSGTLSWADGDLSDKTILVPIRPDILSEGTEDLTLTLSNPTGGVLDAGANSVSIRILDPGQRYTTFAPPFFNTTVNTIVPLENGNVLIGGSIGAGIGDFESIRHIARLNADGSVDSSFVTGTGFNGEVHVIVRQSDGSLLVSGDFTEYNGTSCPRFVRISENGAIDSSFVTNIGTGANIDILSIALENDGGILVGGEFDSFNGVNAEALIRLNPNGTRNTTSPLNLPFDVNWETEIHTILVEDDGKIMVGGSLTIGWTGSGFKSGIIRLNSNGTEDGSFNPDAGAHADGANNSLRRVYSIQEQADGKYLLGGLFTAYDENPAQYIARITNSGAFDSSFTPPNFNDNPGRGLLQPNDSYVVIGGFTTPAKGVERLESSGSADTTFNQGTGIQFNSGNPSIVRVFALAEDPEGQLWLGGNFFSYNGDVTRPVIRIAGGVSPYDIWIRDNFTSVQIAGGLSDPYQDPDNDNITNLAELALGTNPNLFDSANSFGIDTDAGIDIVESGGNDYLQISFIKTGNGTDAWLSAQFSGDLQVWSPSSPTPGSSEIVIVENSAAQFTVRDTVPISPTTPRFGRILLQEPN